MASLVFEQKFAGLGFWGNCKAVTLRRTSLPFDAIQQVDQFAFEDTCAVTAEWTRQREGSQLGYFFPCHSSVPFQTRIGDRSLAIVVDLEPRAPIALNPRAALPRQNSE